MHPQTLVRIYLHGANIVPTQGREIPISRLGTIKALRRSIIAAMGFESCRDFPEIGRGAILPPRDAQHSLAQVRDAD
jgi:hypothetical protein